MVALVVHAMACDSSPGKGQSSAPPSPTPQTDSNATGEGDAERMISGLRRLRHLGCECRTSSCLVSAYQLRHRLLPLLEQRARLVQGLDGLEIASLLRETSDCLPSRAQEARDGVERIYTAAREYYLSRSGGRLQASFPQLSAGPTPPLGACCKNGGMCDPDPILWAGPEWRALAFSVEQPHSYSFEYRVTQASGPNASFTARAIGDLDCDGEYSTFQMIGDLNQGHAAPR